MSKVITKLPESWQLSTLGSFSASGSRGIVPNKTPKAMFELYSVPSFEGGAPEIITGAEIGSNKQIVDEGTVLLCKINPRINRSWVVGSFSNNPKIASTEWITFPPNDEFEPKYLSYYLKQDHVRDYLSGNASGVGGSLMRVKPATIKDYPFPLAPRNEQKSIVAEIEKQFSRLDEAVANLKRVKANLKRYKAAVLNAACMGKIGGVNRQAWTSTTLGAIAMQIRNGYSLKPDAEQGTRIFRISAVRPLTMALHDVRYLSGKSSDYADFQVMPGDILFTRYNGNPDFVGVCAVVPDSCPPTIHPDKLIRVKVPDTILIPQMLVILASAGESRAFLKQRIRTTAGQAGISGGDLKSMPVSLPPIAEQFRIVAEVDRLLSTTTEIEAQVTVNLIRAERLRQAVLKYLFSGRVLSS